VGHPYGPHGPTEPAHPRLPDEQHDPRAHPLRPARHAGFGDARAIPVARGVALAQPGSIGLAHFVSRDRELRRWHQPGTYRVRQPADSCYWARLSGFGGTLDEIVANYIGAGYAVVTISPTDVGFRSERCGTWSSDLSRVTASTTSFGEGTLIVSTDVQPSTYRSSGTDSCYWARLSGFGGTLDDIIANHFGGGPAVATILASDRGFKSSGCGTWAP